MNSSRDVLIQSNKIDEAALFYEKILGFNFIKGDDQIIGFETGSFRLFIDRGEPYGPVFEFFVPDLELAKKTLVQNGCRIEDEDPNIPKCYIRDPYGLIFNIAMQRNSK